MFILAIVSVCVGTLYVYVDHVSVGAVRPCSLPAQALLAKYTGTGAYTDCYELEVVGAVSSAEFVEAFYTGKAFKVERFLNSLFYPIHPTDAKAKQLAGGEIDRYSGWQVEDRNTEQLLMRDMGGGRFRSRFMVAPQSGAPTMTTRLYFGSAVLPRTISETGEPRMSKLFAPLLRFHKFYSQVLLDGARARLAQRT
jgi:hypothetical protein